MIKHANSTIRIAEVAAISATKSNDNSFQEEMRQADQAQAEAMQLADQDAQVYTQVVETYRLKAATDVEKKERRKNIDSALEKAFHGGQLVRRLSSRLRRPSSNFWLPGRAQRRV